MKPTILDGRYQLLAQLGRGGMGEVFEAADLASDRIVALKRLSEEDQDVEGQLRFQREFHTLAGLEHPRIVKVFDYGVDETGPYYTMERLEGTDLSRLITKRKRLLPQEACRILRDVASALTLLHARGLVHRDLSPRNVRVVDGHAVLIDFGVLVNAGVAGDVAGTPSFVAPEMLRGRPLDGRTDLYALGVLGYAMLTGRLPYPARRLQHLDTAWKTPPPPPSTLAPVPRALEELISDLLRLEPSGRPRSAALLVDKLTAAGGLEPDPALSIQPGYAPSASLVGRARELRVIDRELDRLVKQRSSLHISIEAESGVGKSRLLEELAIRAQIRGARCVSVDCDDERESGVPFAAIARLLDAAFGIAPEQTYAAAEPYAPLLCRVFPTIRDRFPLVDPEPESGEPAEARIRLQETIVSVVRRLAITHPLVLLVDDVQRCDEASAGVLAALVRERLGGLLLCVTRRLGEEVRAPGVAAILSAGEPRIQLAGLNVQGVSELLRSLFGDLNHLSQLAQGVHSATAGNPLLCNEIARHLVEEGIARYHDGSWVIPKRTALDSLPPQLKEAMQRRVDRLPAITREVGEMLALHGGTLSLERCTRLVTRWSGPADAETRTFLALDELQRHGVLVEVAGRFRFRHASLRQALLARVSPERQAELHRTLAEALLERGEPESAADKTTVGWHLYYAGDRVRGAAYLERAGRALFEAQALADCIAPLEAAMRVAEETNAPAHRKADLGFLLLSAGWVSHRPLAWHHARPTLDLLARLSGIAQARRLKFLGPHLAFVLSFAWVSVRRLWRRRDPSPLTALTHYANALGHACALAYTANHKLALDELIAEAWPMRAFRGTPPFAAYLIAKSMSSIVRGHLGHALDLLEQGLEVIQRRWLRLDREERRLAEAAIRALRILVHLKEFRTQDLRRDVERIRELDFRYYDLMTETAAVVQHRLRGEETRARELEPAVRARAGELGSWSTDLQILLFAHIAYASCHDVVGLKEALDDLCRYRDEGMSFDDRIALTHGELLRERGEYDRAMGLLERCFAGLDTDDALMRQLASAALAESAVQMRDYAATKRWAREGMREAEDPKRRIAPSRLRCMRALALAKHATGSTDEAMELLQDATSEAESMGHRPLAGALHEAQARIAFDLGDQAGYERHLNQADQWVRPTENAGLILMVERLADISSESGSYRQRRDDP